MWGCKLSSVNELDLENYVKCRPTWRHVKLCCSYESIMMSLKEFFVSSLQILHWEVWRYFLVTWRVYYILARGFIFVLWFFQLLTHWWWPGALQISSQKPQNFQKVNIRSYDRQWLCMFQRHANICAGCKVCGHFQLHRQISASGSDWESSHPASTLRSRHFIITVWKLELRCESPKKYWMWRFSFSVSVHKDPCNLC